MQCFSTNWTRLLGVCRYGKLINGFEGTLTIGDRKAVDDSGLGPEKMTR